MKKHTFILTILSLFIGMIFLGCSEPRYYQRNNQHSKKYNDRHDRNGRHDNKRKTHKHYTPAVDINIHN